MGVKLKLLRLNTIDQFTGCDSGAADLCFKKPAEEIPVQVENFLHLDEMLPDGLPVSASFEWETITDHAHHSLSMRKILGKSTGMCCYGAKCERSR